MRFFVIRPFGAKEGIDFEAVDQRLIQPALRRLETPEHQISGGNTQRIVRQGNIREDMFRMIVTADLVIADVSIHNANTFYELGIRHALRPGRTFLMRSRTDHKFPFDLQTDRYFLYDAADPAADVDALVQALRSTLAANGPDSPVFALLPHLRPHGRDKLVTVPPDFREEVAAALKEKARGRLRLLADEAAAFEWDQEGLRLVGEAQFELHAFPGARRTFEALVRAAPRDDKANLRLATIYQRLAVREAGRRSEFLQLSDQAIERVLDHSPAPSVEAEARAQQASNHKTRWIDDFAGLAGDAAAAAALRSPYLESMVQLYLRATNLDLNRHYAAENALGLLKTQRLLAERAPDVWADRFGDDAEAEAQRMARAVLEQRLAALLHLALGLDEVMGARPAEADRWLASSRADFAMLMATDRPARVANRYAQALVGASRFTLEATLRNLAIYRQLGVFEPGVSAACQIIEAMLAREGSVAPPTRVVLFSGHMVDPPDRPKDRQRFPPTPGAEARARALIRDAVARELQGHEGSFLGIAGAACGGDILFHEVCAELGATTEVCLLLPPEAFEVRSVHRGGPDWVNRYRGLLARSAPRVLQASDRLPDWLTDKPDYDVWERNNLWMMFEALAKGTSDLTLIALYNAEREVDGPGGTAHLLRQSANWGFKRIELDARALLEA